MSETNQSTECSSCHSIVSNESVPCPNCGGIKRTIALSITEQVAIQERIRMVGVEKGKSKRNFFIDLIIGSFPSVRKDLSPEGAYVEQRVDRRDNSYTKKVTDAKTGRVIKYLKEKLTSHK